MAKLHETSCATDPISAPTGVNQHWTNTTSGEQWLSNGTTNVANWVKVTSSAAVGIGFHEVFCYGESGSPVNKFIKSSITNHTSLDSCPLALADGEIVHVSLSTEKEINDNWYLQIITNGVKGGSGTFSGGAQIGTDLEKPAGVLDKFHRNLTGYTFSKDDRIQVYAKEGATSDDKPSEPAIRLYIKYTGTI